MIDAVKQRLISNWRQVHRFWSVRLITLGSVLQAAADGYSVMFSTAAVLVAQALGTPVPFDPLTALEPVGLVGVSPNVLVVHPSVPARDLKELQAHGRARREPLRFGSPSISYTTHLLGQELGIEVEEVRYRGTGPLMTDLLAGRLDGYLIPLSGIQSAIRAGELRALAVSYRTPLAAMPGLQTTVAQGFPNLISFTCWHLARDRAARQRLIDDLYRRFLSESRQGDGKNECGRAKYLFEHKAKMKGPRRVVIVKVLWMH